jgi:hypothetical protein
MIPAQRQFRVCYWTIVAECVNFALSRHSNRPTTPDRYRGGRVVRGADDLRDCRGDIRPLSQSGRE